MGKQIVNELAFYKKGKEDFADEPASIILNLYCCRHCGALFK